MVRSKDKDGGSRKKQPYGLMRYRDIGHHDLEDLRQNAILQVLLRQAKEPVRNEKALLTLIEHRQGYKHVMRKGRKEQTGLDMAAISEVDGTSNPDVAGMEAKDEFWEIYSRLSLNNKNIMLMLKDEISINEIAISHGWSRATAYRKVNAACDEFRRIGMELS